MTTLAFTAVVAGNKVVASDVNTPFTTLINFCNSIDGENIQSNTLPGDRIKANSIGSTKLLDGSIPAAKLAANCVTTAKILDDAVTTDKILDLNVTAAKIANATITAAKMVTGIGRVYVSHYAGDGAPSQAITGLGFQPAMVLLCALGASGVIFVTDGMTPGSAKNITTNATITTAITSLDADGFTVADHATVNTNLTTYFYVALAATA